MPSLLVQNPAAPIQKWIEIVLSAALASVMAGGVAVGAAHASPHWPHISPAHAFPVEMEEPAAPVPIPPLPGVQESAVRVSVRPAPAHDDPVPDISYSYFWQPQDGLRVRAERYAQHYEISDHSPGLLGGFERPPVRTPRTRWLPAPSTDSLIFGERGWRARLDESTAISLGSSEIAFPEWNESVRLGGISLSQSFLAGSDEVSQWNYALAIGAVDQSAAASSGDLEFGPTAGSLALSYDYSPRFSVESHTEVGANLLTSGLTGRYDLGALGDWRSGVSRSSTGMRQGWRYEAMADFDLADDLSLSWVGERYTDGFMDLRRYAAGADPVAGERQRWKASWDAGGGGQWSGSFETRRSRRETQQRRFGLSRQFWYSPNLRVGLHAEREIVSDDYDIGLRLSFPLY